MDKLSDFELNKAIAELLYPNRGHTHNWSDSKEVRVYKGEASKLEIVDYCNNWNDLMHLVVEHGVSFLNYQVEYQATNGEYNGCEAWTKENPQRMLAECLLKVLQEKQCDE